jgi:glycosyltransferase involved in cell wall biosynthesis
LKVLLVNTNDTGGAAKACIRLHLGLLAEQIDSSLLLKQKKDYGIPRSHFFPQPPKILTVEQIVYNKAISLLKRYSVLKETAEEVQQKRQQEFLQGRPEGLEPYSFPLAKTDITQSSLYQEADIIHFHWVAGFLDYPTFFSKNNKPILWTLHDASPFLGGEHYVERFLGIDDVGQPIQRNYSDAERKADSKYLGIKRKALEDIKPFPIVAPSQWLKTESQHSLLFNKYPHYHIPYGFPTHIFKPVDKGFCRDILGIPRHKKVLLYVANDVRANRKGYEYLKKAFKSISSEEIDLFLCAIGRESGLERKENLLELGEIVDERLMAIAYSAADIFVLPSLEDNLPNTMIESLLCGTPVVAFAVGGIKETIENKKNGLLCEEISVKGLKQTIEKCFANLHLFDSSKIAKDSSLKYNLSKQAQQYLSLYRNILT